MTAAPHADVVVLGLGALGAATLHRLALRGARVVGLDRYRPGHARGSSHGGSRIIRRALFEHPAYLPVVDRAYQLWREIQEASPRHVFDEGTGLLLAGPEVGELIHGTLEVAARHDLPVERVAAADAARRFPTFSLPPDLTVLFDPDGGILRPEEAVRAQVELAERAGASVRRDTPATGWETQGETLTVTTTAGEIAADRLVVAAGPWAPELLGDAGFPLTLRRKLLSWHEATTDAWRLGRAPTFAFELPFGFLYGFPQLDDRGVKIADHAGGTTLAAPEPEAEPLPGETDTVERAARDVLRGVAPTGHEHAPCTYTMTPDGHPIVGFHPRDDRVLVAAGFCGHGFKHSIALGEALAELALEGRSGLDLSLFAPGRFAGSGG